MKFAIVLVLVVAICGICTNYLVSRDLAETAAIEHGRSEARREASLVTLLWLQKLTHIEALQSLARSLARSQLARGGPAVSDALVGELRAALARAAPGTFQVSLVDPSGTVTWSTVPLLGAPVSVVDRPYYKDMVEGRIETQVGEPINGLLRGKPVILFAEALRGADGALQAISVVTLDVEVAIQAMGDFRGLSGEVVTVVRDDGMVLARSEHWVPGASINNSELLRMALRDGRAERSGPGLIDGVNRLYAAERIPGSPLVIMVGLDQEEVLAPARREMRQLADWSILFSLALTCLGGTAWFGINYRRKLLKERVRIQIVLQREGLLRQMAERATDIISLQDANLTIIYLNPAYQVMLGFDPAGVIGKRFGHCFIPEDVPSAEAALSILDRIGGSQRFTCRMLDAKGIVRWLETEMVAVPADQPVGSNACRYVAIIRDVTDRKHDEDKLRKTQAQIQTLLLQGNGLLFSVILGREGQDRLTVSPLSPDVVFGYLRSDLMLSGFFLSRVYPEDAHLIADAQLRCQEAGEAVAEYRFKSATGDLRWLRDQMTLGRCYDDEHEIVVYVTDITDEHTARLRLQQSERLATLGLVTANIAHEINQPLATIAMAAENSIRALEKGPSMEEIVKGKLERIIAQSNRIANVISHIRMFGRADKSHPEDLALREVVDETMMLAESRINAANVTIMLDLDPELPKLRAAKIPLEQVLLNIVVNACDAYDDDRLKGGQQTDRSIRVTGSLEDEVVLISIADRAGGISPSVIDRVFDPFFTTKMLGKGTGIGLFVSLATINGMGGLLSVRNEAGGAVFDIRLPVAEPRRKPPETRPARSVVRNLPSQGK